MAWRFFVKIPDFQNKLSRRWRFFVKIPDFQNKLGRGCQFFVKIPDFPNKLGRRCNKIRKLIVSKIFSLKSASSTQINMPTVIIERNRRNVKRLSRNLRLRARRARAARVVRANGDIVPDSERAQRFRLRKSNGDRCEVRSRGVDSDFHAFFVKKRRFWLLLDSST